jgi:hypothetical protein
MQAPLWQVFGAWQATHCAPPLPHWASVVVRMHWVPTQQPLQLLALQVCSDTQVPKLLHDWPPPQATQAPASRPHACAVLPGRQVPPGSRHVLQPAATQVLAVQAWVAAQLVQAAPCLPHTTLVSPPRQTPLPSQQPAQLAGLHLPASPGGMIVPPSSLGWQRR